MSRPAADEKENGSGLSSAVMRTRLSAALKKNGTVDALKTQLRAKVLSEMRAGSLNVAGDQRTRPVVEQAANLLVMDYLQNAGYLYTASVFAPESGVPAAATAATQSDADFLQATQRVLDLLHIHPESRLYKRMTSMRGPSTIRTLLEYVTHSSDHAPGVANSACQTTSSESQTIDRKMEQIDERYRGLAHESTLAPLKTLEDKLAQCQRDADARVRHEVEEAVSRVRKVEMSKMRLEEQARFQQQLAQVRDEMETTWQKRLEALRLRESELHEKMSKKEAELESQSYAHRQRMLADMEIMRRRDAESRQHAEDAHQHVARQEAKCRELEHVLEVKLAQVERERADLTREREAELARIRTDMLRLREEEQRELSGQRREVEEQRVQLQIQRDSFGDAMAEAKVARDEVVELKAEHKRQLAQIEALRDEVQRSADRLVEKGEECRRLDEESRRLQERVAEVEEARRELASAGAHAGDRANTPVSRRSSLKGSSAGGRASPAKTAAAVVDQLEELRASHGRERVVKEKQVIQLQSDLKRAGREVVALQQRLSDFQREHDQVQARLHEAERALLGRNKELEELRLQLKMAQHEAEDSRRLLQQSQLALERDRRRLTDDEKVAVILGGVHAGSSHAGDSGGWPSSGGTHRTSRGDEQQGERRAEAEGGSNAWDMELNRLLATIGDLEREDQQLRAQRESLLAGQRQDKLMRMFEPAGSATSRLPYRPPVTYAWGAGEEAHSSDNSAPLAAPLAKPAEANDAGRGASSSVGAWLGQGDVVGGASLMPSASPKRDGAPISGGVQEPEVAAHRAGSPLARDGVEKEVSLLPVRQPVSSPAASPVGEKIMAVSSPAERARREEARKQREEEERRAAAERERQAKAAKEERLRQEREEADRREREAVERERQAKAEEERAAALELDAKREAQEKARAEQAQREEQVRREQEARARAEEEERRQQELRDKRRLDEERLAEGRRRQAAQAEEEAAAKKREEEARLEQQRRDSEEKARKQQEEREAEIAKEEAAAAQRKREADEARERAAAEEKMRLEQEQQQRMRAEAQQREAEEEVKRLVLEGTDAAQEGRVEDAQRLLAAATRAGQEVQGDAVVAQISRLENSVQRAKRERVKAVVVNLVEEARRELAMSGGDKDDVGSMQVGNVRERLHRARDGQGLCLHACTYNHMHTHTHTHTHKHMHTGDEGARTDSGV